MARTPRRKSSKTGVVFGVGPLAVWALDIQLRFSRYYRNPVPIGHVVLAR
jgi:hypothetical protein